MSAKCLHVLFVAIIKVINCVIYTPLYFEKHVVFFKFGILVLTSSKANLNKVTSLVTSLTSLKF